MERTGVGAGDDAPLRAVPVLDQRLRSSAGINEIPHGPDIVGGDAGHPVEIVDRWPGAWAGHDAPGGLCLRHRWCQQQEEQHRGDYAQKEIDLQTLHDTPLNLLLSYSRSLYGSPAQAWPELLSAVAASRTELDPGLGLATTLQLVPFHCSISVCSNTLELGMKAPTAQMSVAETMATPLSPLDDPGLGLATTLQLVP